MWPAIASVVWRLQGAGHKTLHKIAVRSNKQPFGGKNLKKRGLISYNWPLLGWKFKVRSLPLVFEDQQSCGRKLRNQYVIEHMKIKREILMIVFLLHNLCWVIRFSDFVRLVEDTISFIESVSDDSGATVLRTTGLWLVHRLRGRHVPTVVPWRALLPSVLTVRTLFKTLLQIVTTTKPFASYSVVQSLSHLNITIMKIELKIKIQNNLVNLLLKLTSPSTGCIRFSKSRTEVFFSSWSVSFWKFR